MQEMSCGNNTSAYLGVSSVLGPVDRGFNPVAPLNQILGTSELTILAFLLLLLVGSMWPINSQQLSF